jgi:hypothetical protein
MLLRVCKEKGKVDSSQPRNLAPASARECTSSLVRMRWV